MNWVIFLALFHFSLSVYVSKSNPYNQGPLTQEYISLSNVPNLEGWLNVYYPKEPDTYVIILFMTGLDSDVPGGYNLLESHLPTHGIISVSIEFYFEVPRDSLYLIYLNLIEFLRVNLTNYLPPGVIPDVENGLVGMGHSAGCKIVVKTLLETCSFLKGSILLSPVDGDDPWGWINDYVTNPPNLVNYSIPTLLMGTGLDPVPGHPEIPACGPAPRNFERFFTCLRPNMWLLNALDFGHADILDDLLWEGIYLSQFCKTTDDINERHYYIQFVSGAIAAFMIGTVQGNCTALQYLSDVDQFPIKNVLVNVTKVEEACPKVVCQRF